MRRRTFVQQLGLAAALGAWAKEFSQAAGRNRPPRIVLRSSWQTVNIGDIAHTPGVLALLEKYLPQAEIRLWPSSIDNGVEPMLKARFPKLTFVQGRDAQLAAFEECNFMLHGSGPSLVASKDVGVWREQTKKPYGIYGITTSTPDAKTLDHINHAQFAFFRDSVSLKAVKDQGATCPRMEFGPDGAFAVDLRNDAAADKFLKDNQLTPGKFLCCIPRLRYTPYWLIKDRPFDEKKHARNEEMKEHDHAPIRAAIEAVIRQTDLKVLLCPEDQTQMAVSKEMLFDKLPADVKPRVVWREKYWLTDEALSTYVKSAGLFGLEMHSPIMCIGNGIPAIVCRFAEQTSKGYMWRDIGLNDWLFNLDEETEIAKIVPTVLALAKDPAGAREKVAKARAIVEQRQRETMAEVASAVG